MKLKKSAVEVRYATSYFFMNFGVLGTVSISESAFFISTVLKCRIGLATKTVSSRNRAASSASFRFFSCSRYINQIKLYIIFI